MDELRIKQIKTKLNNYIMEKRDIGRIEKILNTLKSGKMNKDNFYDCIRKFTKNTYSDHAIRQWEIISENAYKIIFE